MTGDEQHEDADDDGGLGGINGPVASYRFAASVQLMNHPIAKSLAAR
ncbi:hypothetical protein [Paramagnetospirillum kuznetsovii]|nr:hypothetical protein [Paramagnetospirillum kuznetsovii]